MNSYLFTASCYCILANKKFHQPLKAVASKHVRTGFYSLDDRKHENISISMIN